MFHSLCLTPLKFIWVWRGVDLVFIEVGEGHVKDGGKIRISGPEISLGSPWSLAEYMKQSAPQIGDC